MTRTAPAISRHEARSCPSCGAVKVYRSRRICRCRGCSVRFALLFNSALFIDDGRRALRRATLLLLLMLVGVARVGLAMLWFMGKQAAVGPSDGLLSAPHASASPRV